MGCKEELCRLVSVEGLLLCPQWAAECTSNREIKANQCRIFGFLCLCHGKVHHEFPSPPVHTQPCPELTLPLLQHHCQVLTGKVPVGARVAGSSGVWVHMGSTAPCTKSHQDDEAVLMVGAERGWRTSQSPQESEDPLAGFGCHVQPASGAQDGWPPPGEGGEGKLGCESPPWHVARNGLLVWCALGFYLNQ